MQCRHRWAIEQPLPNGRTSPNSAVLHRGIVHYQSCATVPRPGTLQGCGCMFWLGSRPSILHRKTTLNTTAWFQYGTMIGYRHDERNEPYSGHVYLHAIGSHSVGPAVLSTKLHFLFPRCLIPMCSPLSLFCISTRCTLTPFLHAEALWCCGQFATAPWRDLRYQGMFS